MTTGASPLRSRELQQTERDGVPVFYVESDQTPTAVLTFRAGFVDEPLVERGWFHLLEHCAMHGRDDPSFHTNASVGLLYTDFQVSGELADVTEFLSGVTRWLADPDLSGIEHERTVLEAESAARRIGDVAVHLDYRYGPHGVGAASYPELGLRTATEASLRARTARFFCSGNAALALNFAPPPELALHLPAGSRMTVPRAEPLRLQLPGHVGSGTGDLAVSGLVGDSQLSLLVAEVLTSTATQRLRHELGSSYGTQWAVERVDDEHLMVCLVADVVEKHAASGVDRLHTALEAIRTSGVSQQMIEPIRTRMVRQMRDVPDGVWQAFNSAPAHLRGDSPRTERDTVDRLLSATPEQVQGEVDRFLASALYSSPSGKESTTRLPFNTGFLPISMVGRPETFRPWRHDDSSVLEISDRACRMASSSGVDRVVILGESVAALQYPDGARTVIGADGASIHVEPHLWRKGHVAATRLDAAVDPAVVVPMAERDAAEIAPLPAPWRRVLGVLRRFLANPLVEVGFFGLAALGMLIAAVASQGRYVGPAFLFAVAALWSYYRHDP